VLRLKAQMMKFKPMDDCEVHGVWVRDIPDNLCWFHAFHPFDGKKDQKFCDGFQR